MKKSLVMISALVLLLLAGWIAFRSFRVPERGVRPVTSAASTMPFSYPPDSSLPTPKESPNAATSITPFWPSPEASFVPTAQVVTSPTPSPRPPKKTPQPTPSAMVGVATPKPAVAPLISSAPTLTPVPSTAPTASPAPTPAPTPLREPRKFFVFIVGSQFQPASLEIHVGDTVTWINKNKDTLHWPASDPHPTHTALAGFDALGDIGFEESYSYTFTAAGSLPYHDHSAAVVAGVATVKGTITVTP